jgi:ParB-like chromosome segregation protein Spo0J
MEIRFQHIIPPLSADEFTQLERNILQDGIREPLVLWGDVLVDGHNRYAIAQKHGLPFQSVQVGFADDKAATEWIILNQFGRRNINNYQRSVLALELEEIIAKRAKERQIRKPESVVQKSAPQNKTRDEIAAIAGVSHDTIDKVKKIKTSAPVEIVQKVESGEISINQGYQAVKRAEKQQEITEAQEDIAKQTGKGKPVLHICDSRAFDVGEKYDLLLTDPPYSTDVPDVDAFIDSWYFNALNGVKDTGFAYIFIGAYPHEQRAYLNAKVPAYMNLEQILVWTYKNTLGNNPKDRYKQNYQACLFFRGVNAPPLDCPLTSEQWAVQEINAPDGRLGDRYHAWQKPMEIAERFIRHSTKQGDLVYDPFACTGTFILAAAKLGRRGIGCEINADNAGIAFSRGCERG